MTFCLVVCCSGMAWADSHSFALRAKRVITATADGEWSFEPGMIIVRDGRIVAVASDLSVPPDLPLKEFPDATVLPGLVAASSSLAGAHSGEESVGAAYRAIDAFDPYADWTEQLAGGVTTVHLNPGTNRLVSGRSAVVKLAGPLADRVLTDASDLSINVVRDALDPPGYVRYSAPSSSDVALPVPVRQRPNSRLGVFLALEEALATALEDQESALNAMHAEALAQAWRSQMPLRFRAQRRADLVGALGYLSDRARKGYIVGGTEVGDVRDSLHEGTSLVYELGGGLVYPVEDVGLDPDALEADIKVLASVKHVNLALAADTRLGVSALRLAAATAQRAGLDERRIVDSMTRVPAEILGVDGRVGTIAPGKDADLVVLTGDPLSTTTHVEQLYVGGQLAFTAPVTGAIVVRAGTVWLDKSNRLANGSVLIEEGKITAVGYSVPHPPFARYIDAGPKSYCVPGFIDAFGHLGFGNDRAAMGPDLSPAQLVGVPNAADLRVARSGVTTVMSTSYATSPSGSQVAAIKTDGRNRDERIVRSAAGVVFQFGSSDPLKVKDKLTKRLEAGKKYQEKWKKYEEELAKWKEKREKGESIESNGQVDEAVTNEDGADPITGTWSVTISGGPIPEPETATMRLLLTGDEIEGRIDVPGAPEAAKVVATLDGKHISGEIQVDTGGMGYPSLEADIVEEDHIVGIISFSGIEINLDAIRTDKAAVVFKVVRKKKRGKDGRPLPPTVNELLEPLRAVLDKRIPLVSEAQSAAQIDAVLQTAKKFEVSVVILGGDQAKAHASALSEQSTGVILPKRVIRRRHGRLYHQADDLARQGVSVAFQSDAEDGARSLRDVALRAVERGLSPDAALAALTTDAGKMYQLDDRLGVIKVGADGDIVLFSDHPFSAGSTIKRVIVNGREVR